MTKQAKKRDEYLIVRFNAEEKKRARRVARRAGKAMSTLVREYFASMDAPRTTEAAA